MWKLFQISVFLGVTFAGIHYEWTPSGYALGFVAWITTVLSTFLVGSLLLKLRALLPHQRSQKRLTGGR